MPYNNKRNNDVIAYFKFFLKDRDGDTVSRLLLVVKCYECMCMNFTRFEIFPFGLFGKLLRNPCSEINSPLYLGRWSISIQLRNQIGCQVYKNIVRRCYA